MVELFDTNLLGETAGDTGGCRDVTRMGSLERSSKVSVSRKVDFHVTTNLREFQRAQLIRQSLFGPLANRDDSKYDLRKLVDWRKG